MNEQPEFDFDKVKLPVPQEKLDEIYEYIEDLEARFPLDKLKAITDPTDPMCEIEGEWEVAQNIFFEIQDMFMKMCLGYKVPNDIHDSLWEKLKSISRAIGHYDSTSGKIVHGKDEQ